jgi:phage shock protein PspC (stress-responsive transcriptional regulator)
MVPTDPTPPPVMPAGTPLPPPPSFRLVRSRQRILGGVCSGLATSAGIDVTLVRLAFVAAAFAGVGFVAYGVLWLVVPKEDPAAGRPLQAAPPEPARVIRIAVLVGAVLGIASVLGIRVGFPGHFGGPGLFGLALVGVGIAYLATRHRRDDSLPPPGPAVRPAAPLAPIDVAGPSDGGAPFDPPAPETVVGPAAPGTDVGPAVTETRPGVPSVVVAERRREGPGVGLVLARVAGWMAIIGSVLMAIPFAVLVGLGAISLRLPLLAGLVAFASLALLVGTTVGARRAWPILTSMVMLLGAGALALGLTEWQGGVGERVAQPASAAEVHSSYDLAIGRRLLDLSLVAVPEAGLDVHIDQGIGRVDVVLPAEAAVAADVHVSAGNAEVLGRHEQGTNIALAVVDGPVGAPPVRLDVDLGAGLVRVCRASALTVGTNGCPPG